MSRPEEMEFSRSQTFLAQGDNLNAYLTYWKNQFAEVSPLLNIPTDRPRPSVQAFRRESYSFLFPAPLSERIKSLSQQEAVSPFIFFLAALHLLLARYSGQDKIPIGISATALARSEMQESTTRLSDILVVPTKLPQTSTFLMLLAEVQRVALQAYTNRHIPFDSLLEHLRREKDPGYHPLFQVVFGWLDSSDTSSTRPGTYVEALLSADTTTRPDLVLLLREQEQEFLGTFEYDAQLFDLQSIKDMAGHLQTLIGEIVSKPGQRVTELSLLTREERQILLEEWNATYQEWPQESTVTILFEKQEERTPDAIAVVYKDLFLTYGELNCRANQLAHYLMQRGVGPEMLVGVCLERSPDLIVALLGVLKTGGAYVPIDPTYPSERVRYMLNDAGTRFLITDKEQQLANEYEDLATIISLNALEGVLQSQKRKNPPQRACPGNLCYVIYTSGSTGKPKGVSIQHQGLTNLIIWHHRTYKVTASDRATQISGLAFDATVWELWPYLTAGSSIYLPDSETHASLEQLVKWITISGCTHSLMTTPLAQFVLARQWLAETALRYLLTGGERLHRPARQVQAFQLINHYGPTENTVVATSALVDLAEDKSSDPPIGRPIMNIQTYILDPFLEPTPIGIVGELYIGGPGLARGYLHRPDLTAEYFIPHPFDSPGGARLYRTGDLARYNHQGEIKYVGRTDRQIKVRGFRIELGEIEAVINRHPDIEQAVVILQEDISGEKQIRAYVVLHDEVALTSEELRHYVNSWLPTYMLPSTYHFLKTLPLTSNGKVNHDALPGLGEEQDVPENAPMAPETDNERILLQIWQEVLKREDIGIHDNFFDLGGYSFLMAEVHLEIKKVFKKEISVLDLLFHPTIASFATFLLEKEEIPIELEQENAQVSKHMMKRRQQSKKRSKLKAVRISEQQNMKDEPEE